MNIAAVKSLQKSVLPRGTHLRKAARAVVDVIASRAGVLDRREAAMCRGLTVLTYHRVLPDDLAAAHPLAQLVTPESVFHAQIKTIADRYRAVTVSDGLELLTSGRPTARPLLAITFDDGFADHALIAAPALERAGLPATFFVVAGFIDTEREHWFEVGPRRWREAHPQEGPAALGAWLESLKAVPAAERDALIGALPEPAPPLRDRPLDRAMSTAQLHSLHRSGHEIGSHSLTHPDLRAQGDSELHREVCLSKARLEARLDAPVTGFCYPYGEHDGRVARVVRTAGYAYACTTKPGWNRRGAGVLRLKRIDANPARVTGRAGRHNDAAFRAEVSLLHEELR
jgi:peptidoglycan/xylan/chitin deacetylase (PgdA/CDA1 family)